nr:hypothetical protein [Tanacetum cinerariifolium]
AEGLLKYVSSGEGVEVCASDNREPSGDKQEEDIATEIRNENENWNENWNEKQEGVSKHKALQGTLESSKEYLRSLATTHMIVPHIKVNG